MQNLSRLNLSKHNAALIRFIAVQVAVSTNELFSVTQNTQEIIKFIQYTDNVLDGILQGRWEYDILPEHFSDVERLPEINEVCPQAEGDLPIQTALLVARTGFEAAESIREDTPYADASVVKKEITQECCSAFGFYIAVAGGIETEPDSDCCGVIRSTIRGAFAGDDPISAVNKVLSFFAAPGGKLGSVKPDLPEGSESRILALSMTNALLVARGTLGKEFQMALSLYDEIAPERAAPNDKAEKKRTLKRKAPRRSPGA